MFELIRAIEIEASNGRAIGRADVPAEHPFFVDHFPGRPLLPGTIAVELAAQIAGPLAEEVTMLRDGVERWALLGMIRHAKFLRATSLPASLNVRCDVLRVEPSSVHCAFRIECEDLLRATGELTMIMQSPTEEDGAAIAARRARVEDWKNGR